MILRSIGLLLPLVVCLSCGGLTGHEGFLRGPGWTRRTVRVGWPDRSPGVGWTVDTRDSFTDGGLNIQWGLFPTDPACFSSTTDQNGFAVVWEHGDGPMYFIASQGDFSAAGTPYQSTDPVTLMVTRNRHLMIFVSDSLESPIADAIVQANGLGLCSPPGNRTDEAGISRLKITAAHTDLIDAPHVPFEVRVGDQLHERVAEFPEGVSTVFVRVTTP